MATMVGEPSKRRVLVVDDELPMCLMLADLLSPRGYECRTSSSGAQALDLLRTEQFDVVISDMRMPGISGLDLLETTRASYPHTAFLMATAEDDIRVGIKAMQLGADDYLVKPFELAGVVASVERALAKRRMGIELENYRHNLETMVEERTEQLQAAMNRIEGSYDETLEALGAALDLRDTETEGHSRRVSLYCLEMARAMGCSSDQLKQIERGAYLHDIGKIGTPDAILRKPGALTPEETAIMQTHARIGYNLVSRIAFLAPAAEVVLTHQERYDGAGYPQRLAKNDIPLGARIFAVADTLDAMTSDRSYRRALPFATALAEIKRESGRQFDPEVVRVFMAIPEHVWAHVRQQVAGRRATPPAAEKTHAHGHAHSGNNDISAAAPA